LHYPKNAPSRDIINEYFVPKEIPIHTLYLENRAYSDFKDFSDLTKGECSYLNIGASDAGEKLTGVVSRKILEKIGGSELVASYNKTFGFT